MTQRTLPQDYHMHTSFSIDSEMVMEEACAQAVRRGLREICFTEHVDYVPEDEGVGFFDPAAYFAELQRCRDEFDGRLTIRAGVEVGEVHRYRVEADRLTGSYPFDFVIGSLHWIGPETVMSPDYFDGITHDEAYSAYFAELLRLVNAGGFDVVGHFDVPKRYESDRLGQFDPDVFAEPIREVLRACVQHGVGIEINTGTMRRTGDDPSPSLRILRWYRELGGEILTIGSDAHRPAHIAYAFERTLDTAREVGFTELACFERRQPRFVPLD
jgi:histidinol-phosphatase (PHP family)